MDVTVDVPAQRLTRRYHRRWQATTGRYHALMRYRDTLSAGGGNHRGAGKSPEDFRVAALPVPGISRAPGWIRPRRRHVRPRPPFLPRNADMVLREFFLDQVEDPDGAAYRCGWARGGSSEFRPVESAPSPSPALLAPALHDVPDRVHQHHFFFHAADSIPAQTAAPQARARGRELPRSQIVARP